MHAEIEIPIKLVGSGKPPLYASLGASGADLMAALNEEQLIHPGERALVKTGLFVEIPPGYEIQIRPRSGLALRHGLTVLNTPGTIDSDYRGEICVLLINLGKEVFRVLPGMRVAQMVVAPVVRGLFVEKEALAETARGEGGFGHTGTAEIQR